MILVERTITARKHNSTINEPIMLYRGDYEIELRLTMRNLDYQARNEVNPFIESHNLESTSIDYGQLAILKPDGDNIFSDIVPFNEGAISFVITKEMADEISEIGPYSFHVRLYDENQTSRVTIPPVQNGIVIIEPIASEDHTNVVGEAIAGYALANTGWVDDTAVEPFDEEGNYNQKEWNIGDKITTGAMNKIESAIKTINNNTNTNITELNEQMLSNYNVLDTKINVLDEEGKELTSQLAHNTKQTQGYISVTQMIRLVENYNADNEDWTNAIQYCIDNYSNVYLPNIGRDYKCSNIRIENKNGFKIFGDYSGNVKLKNNKVNTDTVLLKNSRNVKLLNFTVEGNYAGNWGLTDVDTSQECNGNGIYIDKSPYCEFENIKSNYNGGHGILITNSTYMHKWINVEVKHNRGNGVDGVSENGLNATTSNFYEFLSEYNKNGIEWSGSAFNLHGGVIEHNLQDGFLFSNRGTVHYNSCNLFGVDFENNKRYQINFDGDSEIAEGVNIIGCHIVGAEVGNYGLIHVNPNRLEQRGLVNIIGNKYYVRNGSNKIIDVEGQNTRLKKSWNIQCNKEDFSIIGDCKCANIITDIDNIYSGIVHQKGVEYDIDWSENIAGKQSKSFWVIENCDIIRKLSLPLKTNVTGAIDVTVLIKFIDNNGNIEVGYSTRWTTVSDNLSATLSSISSKNKSNGLIAIIEISYNSVGNTSNYFNVGNLILSN